MFLVFSHHFWNNIWTYVVFTAFRGRALWRVLCMHCTCTVQNRTLRSLLFSSAERCNSASGGVEAYSTLVHHPRHTASDLDFLPTCGTKAAMLFLCFWVAAAKVKACLRDFGNSKRELIQTCICTSTNEPSSPGFKNKFLRHVVTSHLIPLRPLDQCCCPMPASEMAGFFWTR